MIGSLWKIYYIVTKLIGSLYISWQNAGHRRKPFSKSSDRAEIVRIVSLLSWEASRKHFCNFQQKFDSRGREGDPQFLMIIVIFISFIIGEDTKPWFSINYYFLHPKRSKQIKVYAGAMAFVLVWWWEKVMVQLNY